MPAKSGVKEASRVFGLSMEARLPAGTSASHQRTASGSGGPPAQPASGSCASELSTTRPPTWAGPLRWGLTVGAIVPHVEAETSTWPEPVRPVESVTVSSSS